MKIDELDKLYIYNRDNKECYFCKKPLEFNQITFDHYLPKSKKELWTFLILLLVAKSAISLRGTKCQTIILIRF